MYNTHPELIVLVIIIPVTVIFTAFISIIIYRRIKGHQKIDKRLEKS